MDLAPIKPVRIEQPEEFEAVIAGAIKTAPEERRRAVVDARLAEL